MRNARRRAAVSSLASILVPGLLLIGSGCAYPPASTYTETPEPDKSICMADAPDWVKRGTMFVDQAAGPNNREQVFFVGRSVGYTTLDERGAFNTAMDDARQQLASAIWGRDIVYADAMYRSNGIVMQPRELFHQRVEHDSRFLSAALVSDLVEKQVYWEVWNVRIHGNVVKRYKCWVLASVPRARMDQLIKESRDWHGNTVVWRNWNKSGKATWGPSSMADPMNPDHSDVMMASKPGTYRLESE